MLLLEDELDSLLEDELLLLLLLEDELELLALVFSQVPSAAAA